MDDSAIMCDKVIESYDEETKTILTHFNEKKGICQAIFYLILINYYSFIDSC